MAGVTVGAAWSRGSDVPPTMAIEILAQAALVLLPASRDEAREVTGYLAGADRVRLMRPLRPGESFVARVSLKRRYGRIVTVHGRLEVEDELVAEADLLIGTDLT